MFSVSACLAQNTFSYQDYHFDRFSVSPAYAGYDGSTKGVVSYSKDWVGFPGSPQDVCLDIDASLLKNMGLGFTLENEKTGIFQNTSITPAYAYRLPISKGDLISFGLQAQIYIQTINASGARMTTTNDQVVNLNQNASAFSVIPGFAMVYQHNRLETGLSVANFVMNDLKLNDNVHYDLLRQFQLHVSYSINLLDGITAEPAVFLVNQDNKSRLYNISGYIDFLNTIWAGISFHDGSNWGIMLGGRPYEHLVIHYSYQYSTSAVFRYSSGSHEITLGYVLEGKKQSGSKRINNLLHGIHTNRSANNKPEEQR
jgi:type IX secretion system PorP/SprF family membrane protein